MRRKYHAAISERKSELRPLARRGGWYAGRMRLAIALVTLHALPAFATECPVPSGADESLAQKSGEERLAFLRTKSAPDARRAKIWTGTWIGAYGALTIGSLAVTALVPEDERVDYYVSAAASFIGLMSI